MASEDNPESERVSEPGARVRNSAGQRRHWARIGVDSPDELVGTRHESLRPQVRRADAISTEKTNFVNGSIPSDHVPQRCSHQQAMGLDDTVRLFPDPIEVAERQQTFFAERCLEQARQERAD